MVTAKNLIKNSKADLGWEEQDTEYTLQRNNVKDYCAQKAIVNKIKASEDKWKKCMQDVPVLDGFKPAIRTRLAVGSDLHAKAVEVLVVDTLKKRSKTVKKLTLKRALKRRQVDEDADQEAQEADAAQPEAPVAIWIADPLIVGYKNAIGTEWLQDERGWKKLDVLETREVAAIMKAISNYLPQGRSIREIRKALEDPDPNVDPSVLTEWMNLKTDAEVKAFLVHTVAKLIRLLVILHHGDGTQDIPPPDPTVPYFTPTHFDSHETYDDPAEDSDQLIRDANNLATCRMPIKDHTFEERKWRICERIQRQKCLLQKMNLAHVTAIENTTTIDSEDEGFCFQRYLKNPVPKTGQQRVLARQVVMPAILVHDAAVAASSGPLVAQMCVCTAAQTA